MERVINFSGGCMEKFLDNLENSVLILGNNAKVKFANKEAREILGYNKDEVIELALIDILEDQSSESDIIDKRSSEINTHIKAKNGDVINCKFKISLSQWNGEDALFIVIAKEKQYEEVILESILDELYKRKETEQELEEFLNTAMDITKTKKLEEAQIEYEKALEIESIKNELFSNISHEFKTPLNIILGTMQVIDLSIKSNKLIISGDVDFDKYQKSIVQNSYRLLRLVNNLIDMTKIDMGYYSLCRKNKNIIYIIEDITMSVVEYIENKGIELIFDTDVEEAIIACDEEKIERIILNLLSNSIKYIKEDGKIRVGITSTDNEVIVSIKDNGIGIPKEKLEAIFQRFVQVDNILTRKCEGSGIGLSIVKSLIDLHGGSISVKSEEGKGTEFIFTLPITTVNDKECCCENSIKTRIEKCNIEFSDIYR